MEFEKIAFIPDFLTEFKENLDLVEDKIYELRRNQDNIKLLDSILVLLKSLKSSSCIMEYKKIEKIGEDLIQLFGNIKDGRIKFSNDLVRLFLFISEQLRNSLLIIEDGKSDDIRFYEIIEINLEKAIHGEPFSVDFEKKSENDEIIQNNGQNHNIKVSVTKLDEILETFDKLIMKEFKLKKLFQEFIQVQDISKDKKNSRILSQIKENIEFIKNQSYSIQDELISMRKMPFSMILQPFRRAALAKALKMGKNIFFEIPETDLKIDNVILEKIPKILYLIVLNSLEHGIESEDERKENGKLPFGTINISVSKMLNRIILTVKDDGRGIDFNEIKKNAIQQFPEDETEIITMNSKGLSEYIFQPGISTKKVQEGGEPVGMGLAIVSEEVDKIKGKIKIESTKKIGTSIEISLPMSLATQEGLFVKAGKYKILFLTHYVKEILNIKYDNLISIQSETVIPLRNELIPVYNTKSVFGSSSKEVNKTELSLVVLEYMENKVAVVVDEILNYMTVVIKPVPPLFKNLKAFQGVVFDEDYKIVPILNVPDLIRRFKILNEYEVKKFEVENTPPKYSILIVDSSSTTRDIEKDIFETEHYTVTDCKDGIEALEKMKEQHFDLIITDTSMPRMDGFVFIHNVRHLPEYEGVPVIVITSEISGEPNGEISKKLLDMEAQAYISKNNFKREKLIETAKELLND